METHQTTRIVKEQKERKGVEPRVLITFIKVFACVISILFYLFKRQYYHEEKLLYSLLKAC